MGQTSGKGRYRVRPGNPGVSGVSRTASGYNFQVEVPMGQEAELLLYRKGHGDPFLVIPLPEEERTGAISAVEVEGITPGGFAYNYRIGGRVLQDPKALQIEGREKFGVPSGEGEHAVRCLLPELPRMRTAALQRPYEETVLYKLHVRGYTRDGSAHVRRKGTFQGLAEKIPYLKELGVTAVELMPVYEYFEMPETEEPKEVRPYDPVPDTRVNYWGYGARALYYAPKAAFSATRHPVEEFAELVDTLHENGLECILEFCFEPDMTVTAALDVLHHWLLTYHVDGFHLIGDGSLAREAARDPLLKKTKVILIGFDAEYVYGGKKPYYRNLGEHNQGYQESMRRFLKGDEGSLSGFSYYLRQNPATHGAIRYFADHDGFTMRDMVSYDQKHNLDNGQDNTDGAQSNDSWNCGAEGATRKTAVRELRMRQLKNAFLILFTSQGTPMIYGGDEFGNSQKGNNNAWCQDNKIGWVDWSSGKKNQELLAFVQKTVQFRREHPALGRGGELQFLDYKAYGCPDISFHSQRAWYSQMENTCRFIGVMYCGDYFKRDDGSADDYLYIAYNMHWNAHELALPSLPGERVWRLAVDTGREDSFYESGSEPEVTGKMVTVPPRSVVILIGRQE